MTRRWWWARRMLLQEAALKHGALGLVYFVEWRMAVLGRYLDAGRRFEPLPDETLAVQWVEAYRDVVAEPHDPKWWNQLLTLHCEFVLRARCPPYRLVKAEAARLRDQLRRARRESPPPPVTKELIRAEIVALRARPAPESDMTVAVRPSRPLYDRPSAESVRRAVQRIAQEAEARTLERIRGYLDRGRPLLGLPAEALAVNWIEAHKSDHPRREAELLDLRCEFDLRGLKPPTS